MPVYQPSAQFPLFGRLTITDAEQLGTVIKTYSITASQGSGPIGANVAFYIPFTIPTTVTVYRLFWNCAGVPSGNFDIGLYDEAGTRLASSGSIASTFSGNGTIIGDIADTTITRGTYYVALVLSSSAQSVLRWAVGSGLQRAVGIYIQNSAFPLPATATFSTANSTTAIPTVGMDLRGY